MARFLPKGISILLLIVSLKSIAQPAVWIEKSEDTSLETLERLDYLDSTMMFYRKSNVDSALIFSKKYLSLADKGGDVDGIDYAHSVMASIYRYKGEYDSSIYYYEKALEGYTKNDFPEGVGGTYSNMANVYKEQSRYDLSITNYFKALETVKDLGDTLLFIDIYSNLAGLYFKLGSYNKAENAWETVKELNDYVKNKGNFAHYYRGKARIAIIRNELKQAEEFLKKSKQLGKELNNRLFLYDDYLTFIQLYSITKEHDKFFAAVDSAQAYRDIDNPLNTAYYFESVGDYYFNTLDYRNAKIYYDSCITSLKDKSQLDDHSYIEGRNRLANKKFYTEVFLDNPYKLRSLYDDIKKREKVVEKIKKTHLTQELDAQYSLREIEEEKEFLDRQNKIYEEINQKNRNQILLLSVTLLLILILVLYMLYNNRRIKRIKFQLEENVKEKELLFRELNHRVKNNLFIINSFIGIEKRGKGEEINELLTKIENRIHSLGLLHEILYQGKMEEVIQLKKYTQTFLESFKKSITDRDMEIKMDVEDAIMVDINKISYVGLIINELLTNACKYGKIEDKTLTIDINIKEEDESLVIKVRDDGKGLPKDFDLNVNMNLKIAKGLTKQLKGKLRIGEVSTGSELIVETPIS